MMLVKQQLSLYSAQSQTNQSITFVEEDNKGIARIFENMAQPFLTWERDIANDLTGAIMLNFKDCISWIYMHTELAIIDQLSFDENACRSVSESKQ